MHEEVTKWRNAQARAEARLRMSRSDAEHDASMDLLRRASARLQQALYMMSRG